MGQVRHGSARIAAAIRAAIQRSQESLQTLATRHGINPKTMSKWRKRTTTTDAVMGPVPASTVLAVEQEAVAVAFRQHTLFSTNACTRCKPPFRRSRAQSCTAVFSGTSRLPLGENGQRPPKKKFKDYPIGYLPVDFAEVRPEEGRQYLFVAIDRASQVTFAELHPRAKRVVAAAFPRRVPDKLPCKAHTVLTDNGVPFIPQAHPFLPGGHRFDRICREYGVAHRLTKPAHPWTNGSVERMNRTIKEATVQRFHYQTTQELNEHPQAFLLAHNHAKRLKTLRGFTPTNLSVPSGKTTPLPLPVTRPSPPWDYTPS